MLTKLAIRNFKRFAQVDIELGNPVVFVGPNNSGKTSALQALTLWDLGLRRWHEKRSGKPLPEKRPGVTLNRRDLIAVPVPEANLLWRNLHVQDTVVRADGRKIAQKARIEIIVDGVTDGESWTCGLEFDYQSEEALFCRPLRTEAEATAPRMPVPAHALAMRIAFLPPMSGLASRETRLEPGAVNVALGEGRTAEVLRNLCHQVASGPNGAWERLTREMERLFGVRLEAPLHLATRGELSMAYRDRSGVQLDLSSAGRGLQQTLLLLAYLSVSRESVLLLDEPDAHLEILRQREVYQVLSETARASGSQVVIATHSEVLLNEAAERDVVIAFVGSPHRINDRGSQVLKALSRIGFEDYYLAEQKGWALYLEGSTDLDILRTFAAALEHEAAGQLLEPFVRWVANQPQKAREHFHGLREAKPDLVGFALFDRLPGTSPADESALRERMWARREIENYLCTPDVLGAWAREAAGLPIQVTAWEQTMQASIAEIEQAMETLGKGSPWHPDTKVSDDFLDPLFKTFYKKLGLPNLMRKSNYHQLARFVPAASIDPEVIDVLDALVALAQAATPVGSPE